MIHDPFQIIVPWLLFCIPTYSIFSLQYPQFTPRTMLHVITQQAPSIGTHARPHWQPNNIGLVTLTSTSPVLTSILPFLLYQHSHLIQHTQSFITHLYIIIPTITIQSSILQLFVLQLMIISSAAQHTPVCPIRMLWLHGCH